MKIKKSPEILTIEKDGVSHQVTRTSFESIYKQSGWNESESHTDESIVQQPTAETTVKPRGAKIGGGTRKRAKASDPQK